MGGGTCYKPSLGNLSHSIVHDIACDSSGRTFIGTEYGLTVVEDNGTAAMLYADGLESAILDNSVYSVYVHTDGSIWLGTFFSGVSALLPRSNLFSTGFSPAEGFNGVAVSSFAMKDGSLFVGTESHGLFEDGRHIQLSGSSDNVHSVLVDSENNLWAALYGSGLYMRPQDSKHFCCFNEEGGLLPNNDVYCVRQASDGNIYIGLKYGGLHRFNASNKRFDRVARGLSPSAFVWDMLDCAGDLYLACYNSGIFRYSISTDQVERISTSATKFVCLRKLSDGRIFAGTEKQGFVVYDPETGHIAEGFPGQGETRELTVYAAEEDNSGHIWLSTNSGIYCTGSDFSHFMHFGKNDGLPADRFNYNASFSRDSLLYFGSTSGYVAVNPAHLPLDRKERKIVLGNLHVNNRQVSPSSDKGAILRCNLEHAAELVFPSSVKSWRIDFTCNDMSVNKPEFAYRLRGLDDNFVHIGSAHSINVNGLKYGRYNLEICIVNPDGSFDVSALRSIKVRMKTPLTLSPVFLAGIALLSLGLVFLIFFLVYQNSHNRHELEISRIERDKENEIAKIKLRFFENVSHEFKTPLTLIVGPLTYIKEQRESLDQDVWDNCIEIIRANADKLFRLINELLSLKNSDPEKPVLSEIPLKKFIAECLKGYRWIFESYSITVDMDGVDDELEIISDTRLLSKVLDNLISNAAKHTDHGGNVRIEAGKDDGFVWLSVRNTGDGITPENLPHVFDRFFTTEDSSGVGLAHVKMIMDILDGKIEASSIQGEFTEMRLSFPCYNSSSALPRKTELAEALLNYCTEDEDFSLHLSQYGIDQEILDRSANETTVLIVDDDYSIRSILSDVFGQSFKVIATASAEDAMGIIAGNPVDIVVSDIMLGKTTGIDLCKRVRRDINTSHIKVILMSVVSQTGYKIAAFEAGADAYIVKPFDFKVLELMMRNMIAHSIISQNQYKISIDPAKVEVCASGADEKFLQRCVAVIFENIEKEDFNVDFFCSQLTMGKTSLYRKIKALTGESIGEFIQNTKLKYAASLLSRPEYSISDIAYMSGFNDVYYFSRAFKKCFGVSPKMWRTNKLNHND
ncbi:MAG: response regulator [Bacteroidales bacterium]|nr:response regulator [Bacteroidales bacterium]